MLVLDCITSLIYCGLAQHSKTLTVTSTAYSIHIYEYNCRCDRADAAGKLLADVLLQREQGLRPVTLIGSSLGGRLIFSCLEEMTRRHTLWQQQQQQQQQAKADSSASTSTGGSSSGFMSKAKRLWSSDTSGSSSDKNSDACCAAGIIENVVLLGAPVTTRYTTYICYTHCLTSSVQRIDTAVRLVSYSTSAFALEL
jgi:Protein of unknown function (DUF726)